MELVVKIFQTKTIQYLFATLIILGALLCVFTPNYFLFKWGESFAMYIMFGYLAGGLIFLGFNKSRLMFTSFACCAGLALYLKDASNGNLAYPAMTTAPMLEVANFNVSASNENFLSTIEAIIDEDADIVSVQEMDPNWQLVLDEALSTVYPYSTTILRPQNFQGIGIFSKKPLIQLDTFYYEDIPNLKFVIDVEGQQVSIISAYIYPEFTTESYVRKQAHLNILCEVLKKESNPVITLGDYNEVQWSGYIRDFRKACQLNDSRRFPTWVKRPTDHVFYSRHFECVGFKSIAATNSSHLGICGTYQFNMPQFDVEKTLQ